MKTKGMTLTEVIITVSIIGLLAAIAIPAVTNYRGDVEEAVCHENLKAMDNAKVQWAVTEGEDDSAEATEEELAEYMIGDFPAPVVAGALYRIGNVVTPALCSWHNWDAYMRASGITIPEALKSFVRSRRIAAADIVHGGWYWYGTNSGVSTGMFTPISQDFRGHFLDDGELALWHYSHYGDGSKRVDIGAQMAEININGNPISGRIIFKYPKELIELNKEYYEAVVDFVGEGIYGGGGGPHEYAHAYYYLQMLEEGGYIVRNEGRTNFYDHQGNSVGYIENFEHDSGDYGKDLEGNLTFYTFIDSYCRDAGGEVAYKFLDCPTSYNHLLENWDEEDMDYLIDQLNEVAFPIVDRDLLSDLDPADIDEFLAPYRAD